MGSSFSTPQKCRAANTRGRGELNRIRTWGDTPKPPDKGFPCQSLLCGEIAASKSPRFGALPLHDLGIGCTIMDGEFFGEEGVDMGGHGDGGLVLNGVRKVYQNVVAVDRLTFTVPRGSMFGLLGGNGAGKTTTLRMVLNILSPDEGTILWNGSPSAEVPRHVFGYLPEERGLYPKMKVGDELVFLAGLHEMDSKEATKQAKFWLEKVGLEDAWGRKVEELSKGNQQKVQVLAALLHDPDLMLMDEPFSGLDPINTEVLRETLQDRQEQGKTIVFSSHRLEQVEEICDQVAIIHKGKLLVTGLISELKRRSSKQLIELAFATRDGQVVEMDRFLQALPLSDMVISEKRADSLRFELRNGVSSDRILELAVNEGPGHVRRFELVEPTLQEIFIEAVQQVDPAATRELLGEGSLPGGKVLTEG
jgi:ABC-2 type transport system ATP-binding protein